MKLILLGIEYSNSDKEEKELKKRIHEKKYYPFHTNYLDKNGNPTDGSIKQIIFGSDELKKKSINDKFTNPSSNFRESMGYVDRIVTLYPHFLNLYEEDKVKELRELLKINDVDQQKTILKQLLKERNIGNPVPDRDLDQLEMIYSLSESKKLLQLAKETGKNKFFSVPDKLDGFMMKNVLDHLFLRPEPEFLNEMILVYLTTIFIEYLRTILKEVFELYPELWRETETKISIEDITSKPPQLFGIFKRNLKFDLEVQIPEWKLIEEKFLRRDTLIHNKGIPTGDYKTKTNHIGDSRLVTDTTYVKESLKTFESVHVVIKEFLWKQYGNPKFLEQMSSEDNL